MPSDVLQQFAICFGFLLFLVPTIICIVLAVRLNELRQRVLQLEARLGEMARELFHRPRPAPPAPAQEARPLIVHTTPPAPTPEKPPLEPTLRPPETHPLAPETQPIHPQTAPRAHPPIVPPQAPMPAVGHPVAPMPVKRVVPPMPPMPAAAPKPAGKPKGLDFYLIAAFIVIGAIAMALAVIFLVKIGIENGYFGPLQRDWAGALTAFVLIAVGQWRRRNEGFWSQGATAAGIVALFATVFAATSVHHFLDYLTGFIFLAIATAATVAMSLQDWSGQGEPGRAKGGMLIAALGLIGGFLTPILVNSGQDNVPGLFGYLILLHIGLIASTRIRGWSILAAASVVLSSLWLMLWVFFKWDPQYGPIFGMFMLATVASLVISTVTQPDRWRGGKSGLAATALTWLAVGLGLLASCLLLGKSHYDNLQWAFFAALVAGAFVLARLRPIYEGMAWLASIAVLGMLGAWGWSAQLHGVDPAAELLADHLRFQGWLMGFGVATVLGAFACQWKSAAPVRWALLACVLALGYVGVGYWLIPQAPRADEWTYLPLAAAGALAALMVPTILQRKNIVTGEECLSVYGHAILALLLMAPPMGLHGGVLTAAWAAILPVTALAIWRLRLPGLLIGLQAAIFIASVRALMVGAVFDAGGEGRNLFWNPVVWAYGTTLVTMAAAAWFLEQCEELPARLHGVIPGPKAIAAMLQVGAAVSAFLLLTLEVRWGFHQGRLDDHSALLVERGTFAIGWLLLAAALTWFGRQVQRHILLVCGEIVAILGLVYAVVGLVFVANPLWWQWFGSENVGPTPVFNLLLYAYGAPAALCGLLAWVLHRSDPENSALAKAAGAAGVILLFAMVSLQVHQGFAGGNLAVVAGTHASFLEFATYSVVWLALGAICLAIGKRFGRDLLRRAGILICSGALAYAVAVVGVAESPLFHQFWIGSWYVLNQLLYAYGTPIVLAAAAAWIAHPRTARIFGAWTPESEQAFEGGWRLGALLRTGILLLLFILVTTEVRQGFQGAYLNGPTVDFFERSTYPVAWLMLAGMLLTLGYTLKSQAARRGGLAIAGLALGFVLLIGTLAMNPLLTHEHVGGTMIFNGLLYAYGVPAAATAILAWALWNRRSWSGVDPGVTEHAAAWIAGVSSLVLIFVLVTLEVQQAFRGDHLAFGAPPAGNPVGEFAAYSLAWAVLGFIYLVAGIFQKSTLLRWASLVMMLITIPKVFLFDMPGLQGLQRVLSFAGLGVSLMALAFVYQRFVFRKAPAAQPIEPQRLQDTKDEELATDEH